MNNNSSSVLSDDEESLQNLLKQFNEGHEPISDNDANDNAHAAMLFIGENIERFTLNPDKLCRIGRFLETTEYQIDLSPYEAVCRGVSRNHASIFMHGKQFYIIDNNSSNGTYIEGQRIPPNKAIHLNKACHIMLGHLRMQMVFR